MGSDVRAWRRGERAGVAWLASACGHCARCRSGRENLCEAAEFTGWDRHGGYAELVTVRAAFALRLPARFDDLAAAPLLCGGVIGYRALRLSGIQPGGRLGLYGFGASASLAIQVARHWACEVFVCTRSATEQERARRLGAVWTGTYDDRPPAPLDAAVTFAPAGRVVLAALRALDRGATVAVNAIHLDRMPAFPYDDLWWERGIRSVANFTRQDAREFLDLGGRDPDPDPRGGVSPARRQPRAPRSGGRNRLRRCRIAAGLGVGGLVPSRWHNHHGHGAGPDDGVRDGTQRDADHSAPSM